MPMVAIAIALAVWLASYTAEGWYNTGGNNLEGVLGAAIFLHYFHDEAPYLSVDEFDDAPCLDFRWQPRSRPTACMSGFTPASQL